MRILQVQKNGKLLVASDVAAFKKKKRVSLAENFYLSKTFMRQVIINKIENKNNDEKKKNCYGSLAMRQRVGEVKKKTSAGVEQSET
jgi:hypothetical protein